MKQEQHNFIGANGARLFYQEWLPEQPKAVLLIAHGMAEHSGRYQHVAEFFVDQGYAVVALDHMGHGQSEGDRTFINQFGDFIVSLKTFLDLVKQNFPGLPVFLIGHSMGGLISASFLVEHQQELQGCALSGPAIKHALDIPKFQEWIIRTLAAIAPKTPLLQLDANLISRDPAVVEKYVDDPLVYSGKLAARTLNELFKAMEAIQQNAATIRIPLLLMHGDKDELAAAQGSEFLHEHVGSDDVSLKLYPGLFHEIFNEPEQVQVLTDLLDWLEAHMPEAASASEPTESAASVE